MTYAAPPDDNTIPIHEDEFDIDPNESRGDVRFSWRTSIEVPVRERTLRFETVNVSFGGIFVLAKVLPRVGGRVRVRMRLAPSEEVVELDCIVRHVVDPEHALDAAPGFGLELALDDAERDRWGTFIEYLSEALRASTRLRVVSTIGPDSLTKVLPSEVFDRLNEIQAELAPTLEESGETRSLSGDELDRLLGMDAE
jgi:hypothetical protein